MITKILVQIEDRPETRWLKSPEDFQQLIRIRIESLAMCYTMGTVPSVTVTAEENKSAEDVK